MSTIDSEDRNVTGYFLPEDSQLRLKQLCDYVGLLANLARPRQAGADHEWIAKVGPGEVANCLGLLSEQIAQVLREISWPAVRGEHASAAGSDAEADAGVDMADEAADTAEPVVGATRYTSGVTLEQIDDMQLLLGSLRALANVVTCADHAEYAKATLSIMGDAIHRDVGKLREIVDAVDEAQRLTPRPAPRPGVAEEHAAYLAHPAHVPLNRSASFVREHPTYQ